MQLPIFLTKDPDGSIRLTDHRIGLESIVFREREGLSVPQIAERYPTLSFDLIQRVIQFYREHRAELEPYVDAVDAELRRQEQAIQPGPSFDELKARMSRLRAKEMF
jgi:uncharacterized protein (DUF433 family)